MGGYFAPKHAPIISSLERDELRENSLVDIKQSNWSKDTSHFSQFVILIEIFKKYSLTLSKNCFCQKC